jgi:O-antigen/teichoic acid export membrane protein
MDIPDSDAAPLKIMKVSLKNAVVRGTVVTVLGNGASSVIRLAGNLVMTRLLFPEYFGAMALVNVFLAGLAMLSDVGVGPSIIQNQRGDDPVFLNTAWTVQVIRGAILWLCACAIAWPVSLFYEKPQLAWLIPAAGISALVGGFESTRLFTANRHLALGRIVLVELVSQVLGVATMVLFAWPTRSIWALVLGGIVSALVKTILSHAVLPGSPNRFAWEPEARKSLLDFGRWIFLSTAITFFSGQSDKLILGKLVDTTSLGLYGIAATLASMPGVIVNQASQRVFFPAVSKMLRRPDHDPAEVRQGRSRLLLVMAPFFGVGIALAVPVVGFLYDSRYQQVGVLTVCSLLGVWLNTLTVSYGAVLLAAGRPKYIAAGTGLKTVLFAALVWPAMNQFGLAGAAMAMSFAELGVLVLCMWGCRPLGVVTPGADLKATLVVGGFAACTLLIHRLTLKLLVHPMATLGLVLIVALGAAGLAARTWGRSRISAPSV